MFRFLKTQLFLSMLILSGCAAFLEPAPEKLVVPWSDQLAAGEAPLPFVAKYQRDDKSIVYVASEHANRAQHETFKLLKRSAKEFPAQIVLIEGLESEKGYSPKEIKEKAMGDGIGGEFKGGETMYAAQIAVRKKVPFRGLEPTPAEMLELLKNGGEKISATELMYYRFLKHIPKWRREGTLAENAIARQFTQFADNSGEAGAAFDAFTAWYKTKNKQAFKVNAITDATTAPVVDGHYTQKLASAIVRARDLHMIQIIQDELRTKDRLFIVVNGRHWMTQKLALERISGFPSFEYKEH